MSKLLPPKPVDYYRSPYKLPTPRERELLDILQEECAEVIVAASKMLRFGAENSHLPAYPEENRLKLSEELGHLIALRDLVGEAGLIDWKRYAAARNEKFVKLAKFLQTEEDE